MKKISLIFVLYFTLTACVTTPPYIPQTMFPNGTVSLTPIINTDFSTPLNKFIEIEFFNDNREWVEIDKFTLETSKETPSEIISDQEGIDQWLAIRSQEKMDRAGADAGAASFGFAILGLGIAIAEIASGAYNSDASTAALITSDIFAVAAEEDEINTAESINQSLENAPLSPRILLPPGKRIKRWFVISTPDDSLPSSFFIKYTAKGRVSGVTQDRQIELINGSPDLVAKSL